MIQLIRNSIAHGIEERGVRMASGKLIGGTITIDLEQPDGGDLLQISYSDDGRGLDLDKIAENAVTRNVLTEYEAQNLTNEKIIEMIFVSGFSTSKEVDEHSGRGEGMSLVASLIKDMSGTFKVEFEEGKFFRMIISMPLVPVDKNENIADETSDS